MNSTAVILAAGRGQKINPLHTPKPLLLVFGKPLILYRIERLQAAGLDRIFIVVGAAGAAIRETLRQAPGVTAQLSFIDQPNDDAGILDSFQKAAAVVGTMGEGCIITSSDLIFETNPFLFLTRKDEIEILIDKHVKDNAWCGAGLKVKTALLGGLLTLGQELEGFNAWHAGVYWFSKAGLARLGQALEECSAAATLPDILMVLHRQSPIRLTSLPRMTWFDINTTETLIRAEMFLRSQHVSRRPTPVALQALKPIEAPLSFSHQKSQTTKVVVQPDLLRHLAEYKLMESERIASHHIIITDSIVDSLYGEAVLRQMQAAGYVVTKLVVPAGERTKSMGVYNDLAERITALGIDEGSVIFALGGGVAANLAGFLAATLFRGIGLIHIPTTIMSMLDVAISLKQGINSQMGKNLVGSYYQPLLALIDPAINMPDGLVRDGLAEAIKHAICQDQDFFDWLLNYLGRLDDTNFRTKVIERTIQLKIELMREDMFEHHRALILQYGHEVGHALEFLSGFELTHGQAISIGMRVSAELARLMGVTGQEVVAAHKEILRHYKLPYQILPSIEKQAIVEALRFNKKRIGDETRLVLPERIGKVWKIKGEYGIPCPTELIEEAIDKSYSD